MKQALTEALSEREKLETATRQLEVELLERDVSVEDLEASLVHLRRELENEKVARLKKAPHTQGTLTDLHNLKHRWDGV